MAGSSSAAAAAAAAAGAEAAAVEAARVEKAAAAEAEEQAEEAEEADEAAQAEEAGAEARAATARAAGASRRPARNIIFPGKGGGSGVEIGHRSQVKRGSDLFLSTKNATDCDRSAILTSRRKHSATRGTLFVVVVTPFLSLRAL